MQLQLFFSEIQLFYYIVKISVKYSLIKDIIYN